MTLGLLSQPWTLAGRRSASPCPPEPRGEGYGETGKILLLICREEICRQVLKVVLETAGYRVIEALHVPEGMRASSRLFPKPDLAVVVAGLGGGVWASLDLLRSALDQAPLLVMSPEEVGCMLDSLEGRGRERADHPSQWLARVHRVLHEGECESALSLNLV